MCYIGKIDSRSTIAAAAVFGTRRVQLFGVDHPPPPPPLPSRRAWSMTRRESGGEPLFGRRFHFRNVVTRRGFWTK